MCAAVIKMSDHLRCLSVARMQDVVMKILEDPNNSRVKRLFKGDLSPLIWYE